MTDLFFEGLSNSDENDLFMYDGSGVAVDLSANFDSGNAGLVFGYDNELGAFGVDPGATIIGAGSNVYFASSYDGLSTLSFYNKTTQKITVIEPAKAWGSGVTPQDLVADGSELYFVGVNSQGIATLWKSNGTTSGTKEVGGSPEDSGDMTLQGSTLYFRSGGHLESYNTQTGAFAAVANSAGINPQDVVSAYSSGLFFTPTTNLFMAGTDSGGKQNIYVKSGSTLEEFKSNVYSGGMDPFELTAVTTDIKDGSITINDSGVYFSGIDKSNGERGLYFVNTASGSSLTGNGHHYAIDEVASSVGGASDGLDPYDLTAFKGELYFTGDDQYSSGRGLFVYNPTNNTVTELFKSTQLDLTDGYESSWGSANAPTMGVYNGELFFGASNPNATGAASVPQLYEYSGSGTTATLVSVNGQVTFGGQPANLATL